MIGFHLQIDCLRIFVVMRKSQENFYEVPYGSYVGKILI